MWSQAGRRAMPQRLTLMFIKQLLHFVTLLQRAVILLRAQRLGIKVFHLETDI